MNFTRPILAQLKVAAVLVVASLAAPAAMKAAETPDKLSAALLRNPNFRCFLNAAEIDPETVVIAPTQYTGATGVRDFTGQRNGTRAAIKGKVKFDGFDGNEVPDSNRLDQLQPTMYLDVSARPYTYQIYIMNKNSLKVSQRTVVGDNYPTSILTLNIINGKTDFSGSESVRPVLEPIGQRLRKCAAIAA